MERIDALSVIVVTHNSERFLPPLSAALPGALTGVDAHELVIVDSGSTDATLDTAARLFPAALLVDLGSNGGYSTGINRGIAATSLTGAIMVLNPDTEPAQGSFALLARALGASEVGITVPRLLDAGQVTARSLRRRPTILRALGEAVLGGSRAGRFDLLGEVVQDAAAYESPGTWDWATGAAFCISRSCADAVGPWDESFFLYSEETDFALRAADAGFTLRYLPEAEVHHAAGDSLTSPRLYALLSVNRVRCYRKRHSAMATAAFWLAVVLNEGLRAVTGSPTHRAALSALFRPRRAVVVAARGG